MLSWNYVVLCPPSSLLPPRSIYSCSSCLLSYSSRVGASREMIVGVITTRAFSVNFSALTKDRYWCLLSITHCTVDEMFEWGDCCVCRSAYSSTELVISDDKLSVTPDWPVWLMSPPCESNRITRRHSRRRHARTNTQRTYSVNSHNAELVVRVVTVFRCVAPRSTTSDQRANQRRLSTALHQVPT